MLSIQFDLFEIVIYDFIKSSLALAIIVILFVYLMSDRKNKSRPPGPFNTPFIGYWKFFSTSKPHELFAKLRGKYGNVIGFYLGNKYCVVLNEIASIKKTLNEEEFLDRPKIHPMTAFEKNSMFASNGNVWKQEKRFALKVFHDLGYGKKEMEERMMEELSYFMHKMKENENRPFNIKGYLISSVNNNITSLLFGQRFEYDDPKSCELIHQLHTFEDSDIQFDLGEFFPFLRPLLYYCGMSPIFTCIKSSVILSNLLRKEVEEHKKTMSDDYVRDYIDGYLQQMNKEKDSSSFSDAALIGTAKVMYLAGSSTTVNTVLWLLLALIANPDAQSRIHKEIDDVLGRERCATWSDHKVLPYTRAAILESQRWRTLLPFSVIRSAAKDTSIMGYKIPKDTIIFPNIWAVHNDPDYWENPEKYTPERFLDETGKLVGSDRCIPFSTGRRSCPGENLAQKELFLYTVALMQKYTVRCPDDVKPYLDGISMLSYLPKPFNIVLEPRIK